jgi:hypothetical protein
MVHTRHAMVRRDCDIVPCFDKLVLGKAYGMSLDNLLRQGLGDSWSCLQGGEDRRGGRILSLGVEDVLPLSTGNSICSTCRGEGPQQGQSTEQSDLQSSLLLVDTSVLQGLYSHRPMQCDLLLSS